MTIMYNDTLLKVTGETALFYICRLVEGNEETIYVPKEGVETAAWQINTIGDQSILCFRGMNTK
jgi:hypothetical protein